MMSMYTPYQNLHIYFIEGCLDPDIAIKDESFIGNWEEEGFSFLFFSKPSRDAVEEIIDTQSRLSLLDTFHFTYDEWYGGEITRFQVGKFLITPPWEGPCGETPIKDVLPVILDPGVVFGSGTHPTTQDCLAALERAFRESKIESVLDLGTGTGVLAAAAARLGAHRVVAVDTNFLAVKTAKNNIRLNSIDDRVLAVQGRAEDFIGLPMDMVIANIHYDVIKDILNTEECFCRKWFILSGLLRSQARDVVYRLMQPSVEIIDKWERDGIWHTFFGRFH
jgi:ribosomal protein L11 methyltransferase